MNQTERKSLEQVVEECGRYPIEAFEFVRMGLNHTVQHIHGNTPKPDANHHVTGQELSRGLRDFALSRYGVMARVVLSHWRIYRTQDFGRIVFAMVDNKLMQKTDEDNIRDFEDVFDFREIFDPPVRPQTASNTIFKL